MDLGAIARGLRMLRIRRRLTQHALGELSGVSRSVISRMERGMLRNVQLGDVADVASALGATADLRVRWNGESLDRLLDEAHAALVERLVIELETTGWECFVEVTFSIYGERGSIDVLGLHRTRGAALLCEVKSVVPDNQATLMGVDRKERLLPRILEQRGRRPTSISRLLVIGDSSTARRRVARHGATFNLAFPIRGRAVARWLRDPAGPMSGLMFLPIAPRTRNRRISVARERVRPRAPRLKAPQDTSGGPRTAPNAPQTSS